MSQMVRKQIYIQERQETMIKQLAQARGVSESEVIRQAIDHEISSGPHAVPPDATAWERLHRFMLDLYQRGPLENQPRQWSREDLYADRIEGN
ncbi:MAG: ribbon-helix-helix protein, CopG family [Chloroflexi bacterium]|nr:ribbon-helix-helix protein, CopG family [Chloroflexota bacterium]